MATEVAMIQFVSGLKSRQEETRIKTANELLHFVSTELREMPVEEHTQFMDQFNHHIFEMVSSSDLSEKKGGILAIGKYIITFKKEISVCADNVLKFKISDLGGKVRVSTVRERVRENYNFSRSGNCHGILKSVRLFFIFSQKLGNVREF